MRLWVLRESWANTTFKEWISWRLRSLPELVVIPSKGSTWIIYHSSKITKRPFYAAWLIPVRKVIKLKEILIFSDHWRVNQITMLDNRQGRSTKVIVNLQSTSIFSYITALIEFSLCKLSFNKSRCPKISLWLPIIEDMSRSLSSCSSNTCLSWSLIHLSSPCLLSRVAVESMMRFGQVRMSYSNRQVDSTAHHSAGGRRRTGKRL